MKAFGTLIYLVCNILLIWMSRSHFLAFVPEFAYITIGVMNLGVLLMLRQPAGEEKSV